MTQTPDAPTLQPLLQALRLGNPIGHRNLTLVPLRGGGAPGIDYVLGEEAIRAGTLEVTEIDESGSVPELLAVSKAEVLVLLVDGEELVGAKQNRILNTSVLLRPRSKTRIPVSCVEEGRWHHRSAVLDVGAHSPSRLRAAKARSVGRNLLQSGIASSDQGEVWEEVDECLDTCAAESPTGAMHDAVQQRREGLDAYVQALGYPEGATGVLVAIQGRFVALDAFDRPAALQALWPRLITGYAMDALGRADADDEAGPGRGSFSAKAAQIVLDHLAELPCTPCPTVGVGEDWRFEAEDLVGQALVAHETAVHICAFPNESAAARHDRPARGRIQPPSTRRRRRRGKSDDAGRDY